MPPVERPFCFAVADYKNAGVGLGGDLVFLLFFFVSWLQESESESERARRGYCNTCSIAKWETSARTLIREKGHSGEERKDIMHWLFESTR